MTEIPVRLDFDSAAPAFSRAMSTSTTPRPGSSTGSDRAGAARAGPGARLPAQRLRVLHRHAQHGRPRRRRERAAPLRAGGLAETPFFSARERAALAFTESVTLVAETHVPAADYDAVAEHFSPDEIGALVSLIVTINAWNALSVSTRAWVPGSYVRA